MLDSAEADVVVLLFYNSDNGQSKKTNLQVTHSRQKTFRLPQSTCSP